MPEQSPLDAIKAPKASDQPDRYTEKEQAELTASKKLAVEHARSVERLEQQVDAVRVERDFWINRCGSFEGAAEERAALRVVVSQSRWTTTMSVVAMGVGGGLISSTDEWTSSAFGAGWAAIGIGGIFLLGSMFSGGFALNRHRPRK